MRGSSSRAAVGPRLYQITKAISMRLMQIHDKPMID